MCSKSSTIIKQVGSKVTVFRGSCRSWSCRECAPLRRKQLIREALDGKPNRFITLTVNPHWFNSPEERAAKLAKAWRLTVAAYRHRWPNRTIEYLAVFEATKLGEPHLHIVSRGDFMAQKWLSGQMRKRMGAPIVDIRAIKKASDVAKYVTKYISKRSIKFGTCKRYWRSSGYLAISPAKARKLRNVGAIFYIYRWSHVSYQQKVLDRGLSYTIIRPGQFEFDLPANMNSPPEFWLEDGFLIKPPIAA